VFIYAEQPRSVKLCQSYTPPAPALAMNRVDYLKPGAPAAESKKSWSKDKPLAVSEGGSLGEAPPGPRSPAPGPNLKCSGIVHMFFELSQFKIHMAAKLR